MFDFASPLFWYKLVFVTELVLAEALICYRSHRREKFAFRVTGALAAIYLLAFLFPLFMYNAIYASVMFSILFGATLFAMKFCFDEPWGKIIFCGILAYTTQHISYSTYNYFCTIFDLGGLGAVYDGDASMQVNGFTAIAYFSVYALVYWLVWIFPARRLRQWDRFELENSTLLVAVAVILLTDVILNAFTVYDRSEFDLTIRTVLYLYGIIACFLSMGIQFSLLSKHNAEDELKEVQALWRQDKRMYELSKQNVELINIKCHDLKHQIKLLRHQSGEITREALKEIERAVNFYDGAVSTGNDVLDLILAEKSLYCSEHGIRIMCIADGAKLDFIPIVDLYSLMENAIRNAIEAVEQYDDPDKKFIRIKIEEKGNFVSIHIENWVDDEKKPVFSNGLPRTTKEDADYHGYGMKSMKYVTEKCGGGFSAQVADNLFMVDIVFPRETYGERK